MFSFLTFSFFIMAVILPSGRLSKGKPSAEVSSQLDHHLPKSAQALVSPLSDDDREVLHYMLAFGLHVQMLSDHVLPASKLQWKPWKASSAKVGVKGDHAFSYRSLHSVSGRPQKALPLSAHKPSCSCDCFSCYSSFWSRWAASPNRDLLNMIIEISEMCDEGDEPKASKGKEKKKKQRTLESEAGGKKAKGGKWKLQSTLKASATISAPPNMVEITPITEIMNDTSGCISMDVSVMLSEVKERFPMKDVLPCRTEVDAVPGVSTVPINSLRDARFETPSWVPSKQGRAPAMVQDEVDGSSATKASSPGGLLFPSRQGKNNLKFQRAGKRKSSQVTPLVFDSAFVLAEEVQDSDVSTGKAEGSLCPSLADAPLRGKGFLSRIFPDALCDIASRLWDLVSMGSRNCSMDYY